MADGGSNGTPARKRLIVDLFCGAGGLSTGAARAASAMGVDIELVGINHWPVAIETNRRNHPEHAHRITCADLEVALPLSHVPEGSVDLLIAAPSCVYHSRARGGRPVHDQQRMDPWHVVRWCTELRVRRLLVENVPEFVDWGPCDVRTARPIKARRGEYFRAWVAALQAIGFRIKYHIACAADYGDPQTRRRLLLIGCSDRKRLRFPAPSHAPGGTRRATEQLPRWRGAKEIIDWSIRGSSIFGRKRPLKPKTLLRLLAGARKYFWPQPYIDAIQALLDGREPILRVPTRALGIADPMTLTFRGTHAAAVNASARSVDQPIPTVSAGGRHTALVMAVGAGGAARPVTEPVPTITAGGNGGARPTLADPIIVPVTHAGARRINTVHEPLPTITGANRGELGIAEPLLMATGSNGTAKPVSLPAPTITTGGGGSARPGNARPQLIEPLIVHRCSSTGRNARPVDEPLPTIATRGAGYLAEPILAPYYSGGSGTTATSIEQPVPALTTKARHALAEPMLIRAAHGDSDGRDPASRVLDAAAPLPAVTGSNEFGVAHPVAEAADDRLVEIDIHYRMLHWRELAGASSFDDEGEVYDFAGTATEITKQIGNAVPCRMGKAHVRALLEDI